MTALTNLQAFGKGKFANSENGRKVDVLGTLRLEIPFMTNSTKEDRRVRKKFLFDFPSAGSARTSKCTDSLRFSAKLHGSPKQSVSARSAQYRTFLLCW